MTCTLCKRTPAAWEPTNVHLPRSQLCLPPSFTHKPPARRVGRNKPRPQNCRNWPALNGRHLNAHGGESADWRVAKRNRGSFYRFLNSQLSRASEAPPPVTSQAARGGSTNPLTGSACQTDAVGNGAFPVRCNVLSLTVMS